METIAVYWEAQIRIYGLTERRGLSLWTVDFPHKEIGSCAEMLAELDADGSFDLVFSHDAGTTGRLALVPGGEDVSRPRDALLWQRFETIPGAVVTRRYPVALLYLHGPHFQDRYGIAEAALAPLRRHDIPILAMGCAGTSVHLVVADLMVERVRAALAETFVL